MLTPAVRSLRERHPGAELVFLTLASNRQCAEGLGVFDRVISLDVQTGGWGRVLGRLVGLVRELRRERFDVVYDFEFFTRFSAVVAVLTGAASLHGFASTRVWRGRFHTHVAPFNRYWHVSRNFRVLAGGENATNVTAQDLAPHRITDAEEDEASRLLFEHGIAPDEPFCVLNPNAGTLSLERRWPAPMFAELGRRTRREDRLPVVLIGARSECDYTADIAAMIGPQEPGDNGHGAPLVNLAGQMTTGVLSSVLARASVVVSNDSGPMHIAAALGAPTVGLFGPETPVMYGPIGVLALALYRPPPCSPCINVHDNKVASCIYGKPQCLVNISVDEVLAAARALRRGERYEIVPVPATATADEADRSPTR
jgi:ADP-heptose:LPS heptosyltransferase